MSQPSGSRLPGRDREWRAYQVPEVARLVEDQFHVAFPHRVWVIGRVERAVRDPTGWRFALCPHQEPDTDLLLPAMLGGEVCLELDEYLLRETDVAIEDLLVDGQLVRAGGLLRYQFAGHRLRLDVSALDPSTTQAQLDQRRIAAVESVRHRRLAEQQRSLVPSVAPVRVHVLTPVQAPAATAVREVFAAAPFAVDCVVEEVGAAGRGARDELVAALRRAAESRPDTILLVREAGRPLSLAPFDTEAVAETIADLSVPVITGISAGGTVADEVAFQVCGDARTAATAVVGRLRRAISELETAERAVRRAGGAARGRVGTELAGIEREVRAAADRAWARVRAAHARRRRVAWTAAVVLAVAAVVAAVALHRPVLLTALAACLLLVLAVEGRGLLARTPSGADAMNELSFAQGLDRLRAIARELDAATTPEQVQRLEREADQLAAYCHRVLRAEPVTPSE